DRDNAGDELFERGAVAFIGQFKQRRFRKWADCLVDTAHHDVDVERPFHAHRSTAGPMTAGKGRGDGYDRWFPFPDSPVRKSITTRLNASGRSHITLCPASRMTTSSASGRIPVIRLPARSGMIGSCSPQITSVGAWIPESLS